VLSVRTDQWHLHASSDEEVLYSAQVESEERVFERMRGTRSSAPRGERERDERKGGQGMERGEREGRVF
jgi:hypothetical protein